MTYQHGTYVSYTIGRCRCADCREATAAYQRRRRQLKAQEQWGVRQPDLVDAQPVRDHIAALRAQGIGWWRIGTLAHVPKKVMSRLAGYDDPTRPQRRVHRDTANRILAVTADDIAPGAQIDAAPTVRRLRALSALGFFRTELADRLDTHPQNIGYLVNGHRSKVKVATARAVAALYDELHMSPGRDNRTSRDARRRGWPPPLAYDDIDAGTIGDTTPVGRCPKCNRIETLHRQHTPPADIAAEVSDSANPATQMREARRHVRRHARWDLLEVFLAAGQVAA